MFHEISREAIVVKNNMEPILTWHDTNLAVKIDKGLQIISLSHDLQCLDKKINTSSTVIPTPKSSPASGLFSKNLLNQNSVLDVAQMVIDPGMWPHNPQLSNEMASTIAFEWSPEGTSYNNESIIAILTNIGNISMFVPFRLDWTCVLDLSTVVKSHYTSSNALKYDVTDYEELKEMVDLVETSAFCWGQLQDSFVTAQRNGTILIWKFESCITEIKAALNAEHQTGIGEIISMVWIPKTENTFILICSNILGQIFSLEFAVLENIKFVNMTCLWTYKDRMVVKYFQYIMLDEKIIIMCNKNRHLLVQILDDSCNVQQQIIQNINDYRITKIAKNKNEYYLSTVDNKLYKLHLFIVNDNLVVNYNLIETRDSYSTSELYSFSFSNNSVMCALGMVDRKIRCRKSSNKIDIVFLCKNLNHDNEVPLLLSNPTRKLTYQWDIIALIRYKTMKLKVLPQIDYNQLYEQGDKDIYALKIYRVLLILYQMLEKILKNGSKGMLPETSINLVKDKISAAHACVTVKNLYKINMEKENLNKLEFDTFIASKKFLVNYCKKYNKQLKEYLSENIFLHFIKMERFYTCQCCDRALDGFTCKDEHLNMFCSLTFTPIEADNYLFCKSCNTTARIDLYDSSDTKPMCLFCDLYLTNFELPS